MAYFQLQVATVIHCFYLMQVSVPLHVTCWKWKRVSLLTFYINLLILNIIA